MARTRVRWGRVAGLAVAAILGVGLASGAARAGGTGHEARPSDRPSVHVYVVRPGDTLWAIAQRAAGPTADPRPLVDAIAARNHVAGTLVPGERLVMPEA